MNNNERKIQSNNRSCSKSPSPSHTRPKAANNDKRYSVMGDLEIMKQRREDRRIKKEDQRKIKIEMMNNPDYIPGLDIDYENMILSKKHMIEKQPPESHTNSDTAKIFVCVRKRPIFSKELQNGEIDCISAINPRMCVYECKMKIDGITKYIDCNEFYFDNVFNERENTDSLYKCSIEPTIELLLQGGVVTCFAYGQTGSGKTFTMKGIQDQSIDSLFAAFGKLNKDKYCFFVSFFEIYTGQLYDLLNKRKKVKALEDKNQKVQIFGLEEKEVFCPQEMKEIVEYANAMRTTHNTVTNETSSRSHAICNFTIKERDNEDEQYAKLSLVDLAGSERATETQSNNRSRLAEGAEINKSLLALKECIRALDARKTTGNQEQHVPFRTSKLTLVLRDSFISKSNIAKIIMISCVSPGYSSANHTINTLRYSDRLKEKTLQMNKKGGGNNNNYSNPYEHYTNNNSSNINNVFHINLSNLDNGNAIHSKSTNSNVNNNNPGNCIAKSNTIINRKPNNNYINEDPEVEDNMQKLSINPTIISKPPSQSYNKNQSKIKKSNTIINQPSSISKTSRIAAQQQQSFNPKCISPNKQHDLDYLKLSYEKKALQKLNNHPTDKDNNERNNNNLYSEEDGVFDIAEEEDFLISSHMNVIKDEAKLLTEEGNLLSNIKGINDANCPMEDYAQKLDMIIKKKLQHYIELKKKIQYYKSLPKETTTTNTTTNNNNH